MPNDDFPLVPDDINPPSPGPSPSPSPSPAPQPDDGPIGPEYDLTKAKITFIDGTRYKHTGKEIKPKIKISIPGNQVNPMYESGRYEYNVTITYQNNVDVGTATVTATALPTSTY